MVENIWVPDFARARKLVRLIGLLLSHCVQSNALRLRPSGRDLNALTLLNQRSARKVLACLGVEIDYAQPQALPPPAFIVANHVSYLDPLVLMALTPSIFITSRDVGGSFPINILAHSAGALLFDRRSRSGSQSQVGRLRALLRSGVSVTVFPEGTTSDGSRLLPFKSALFEAAVQEKIPVVTLALSYRIRGAMPEQQLLKENVYFLQEHSFAPHVLNLLRLRKVEVQVKALGTVVERGDRKQVSRAAYQQIQQALESYPCDLR